MTQRLPVAPGTGSLLEECARYFDPVLERTGLVLPEGALERIARFGEYLLETNARVNLTAARSRSELARRHLADAMVFAAAIQEERNPTISLVDVGSGGGLPGIPLAIVFPEAAVVLVESITKKARFLREAASEIGLPRVSVDNRRAEIVARDPEGRERFRFATSRACAALSPACEYALPLVSKGGLLLMARGPDVHRELVEAGKSLELLGGEVQSVEPYTLDEEGPQFHILKVRKIRATPERYPRASALIRTRPLS